MKLRRRIDVEHRHFLSNFNVFRRWNCLLWVNWVQENEISAWYCFTEYRVDFLRLNGNGLWHYFEVHCIMGKPLYSPDASTISEVELFQCDLQGAGCQISMVGLTQVVLASWVSTMRKDEFVTVTRSNRLIWVASTYVYLIIWR